MVNTSHRFGGLSMAFALMTTAGFGNAQGAENPSNPLAAVTNMDIRAQYFELTDDSKRRDYYLDGATMVTPKLKLKYELHYWSTDVTGSSEKDWESLVLKPIYFPEDMKGKLGNWQYKLAIGGDIVIDFGNDDKGIGSGSDQVAPFTGLALNQGNTTMIPLVQHFTETSGPDVSQTAFRLIFLQAFPDQKMWLKVDNKVPVDWENDEEIPATVELQLGKNHSPAFASYIDALVGVGTDRPYDWGAGVGLRYNY